jgi:cathepsin D
MIIDTGTTLVIAPTAAAAEMYKNVPTAEPWQDSLYKYDCSIEWTAQFTFNGQDYTIPSKYLNLGLTEAGSKWCVSGIAGADMGLGDRWLVGGVFLR